MKVVEELTVGDTKYRLVETESGRQSVELWSSLSKQWRVMYRYDVERQWENTKRINEKVLENLSERVNQNKKPLRRRKRVVSTGKQRKK